MKLAIMQPYFLPYIGYWQLLNCVDMFVVYDDIEYTKKGWINRNRYLSDGKAAIFTVPLKKNSDHLWIYDREISDSFRKEKEKVLRKIYSSYRKAPFFNETFSLFEECLCFERNLFHFIYNSIVKVKEYIGIDTEIKISSRIGNFTAVKGEDKVIAICNALNAHVYINPIGGVDLYQYNNFQGHGVILKFLKSKDVIYKQFDDPFVNWLSIIDVLMFNSPEKIVKEMLYDYSLIGS